jgi:hypothetical protein
MESRGNRRLDELETYVNLQINLTSWKQEGDQAINEAAYSAGTE